MTKALWAIHTFLYKKYRNKKDGDKDGSRPFYAYIQKYLMPGWKADPRLGSPCLAACEGCGKMAAIFFDIDGTLIDSKNILPESTKKAILQLKDNGHQIFICSGRTRIFINNRDLLALGFDGILSGCGTHLEYKGEELLYHKLGMDILEKSTNLFYEYDMPAVMEGRNALFMDADMIGRHPYGERLLRIMEGYIEPIRDNKKNWEASKFSVLIGNSAYQEVIKKLENDFECMVHGDIAMELVPKGFSKSLAVQEICRVTGISPKDTYAFGDSSNDIDMLSYVGTGIAMGNARPPAKEFADYITDGLYEDGIYNALKHFHLI